MTPLQRFVQYCIILNTLLNLINFCELKVIFTDKIQQVEANIPPSLIIQNRSNRATLI